MDYDFSPFHQNPNNWLPDQIRYEGEGIAEFEDPSGEIFGHTIITLDEFGEFIIEMEVEGYRSQQELPMGHSQLLSGIKPTQVAGAWMLPINPYPPKYNLCTRLSVNSTTGEFVAENIKMFSTGEGWNKDGGYYKIRFFPQVSRFDENNPAPAKYWVIPLVNFVSQFRQYDASLARHSLRIYPYVDIPKDIPDEHKQRTSLIATARNSLILFEFNQGLGFIERLPDYEQKEQKLKKHQIPSALTAVMVGSVGLNSIEINEFNQWFPFYFLDLLGLATGNKVTNPWIEFRDEEGNLVRRVHAAGFGHSLFLGGQRAIDEIHHRGGTGRLLTASQSCSELKESYLQAALEYTTLGSRMEQIIEDRLTYFYRGLDALCEYYKLSEQNLLSHTDDTVKARIKESIRNTSEIIESIKEKSGDTIEKDYLNKVIGRLSNIANKERDSGLAICDLLSKFNFPDAEILNAHLNKNPRGSIKSWAGLLSHYRGRVIHTGYFNFRTKEHEIRDIDAVALHLHDILVRVIFTILGYDGKYGPIMQGPAHEEPVDWVKQDTTHVELRYQ